MHDADVCYPAGGFASRRPSRGRPRKSPEGIISKEGVIYDCPDCVARRHKPHPAHTRSGELSLLCEILSVWTR